MISAQNPTGLVSRSKEKVVVYYGKDTTRGAGVCCLSAVTCRLHRVWTTACYYNGAYSLSE